MGGTEVCTRKVRILDVTYNASNNELVRTKTLVKGAIVMVDAHPFKSWYESHYGVKIGLKKGRALEDAVDHQMASGRLFAKITSRPGQSGRCDGAILEGPELAFYQKQMNKK